MIDQQRIHALAVRATEIRMELLGRYPSMTPKERENAMKKEPKPMQATFIFNPKARYSISTAACFALFGLSPYELAAEIARNAGGKYDELYRTPQRRIRKG